MSTLEHAIAIAVKAHKGQRDKGGAPYILHPLRMMLPLETEAERITAVLHDVVEDCEGWSFKKLHDEGFSEEIIMALKSVTKRNGETYEEFIRRSATNPIGVRVKLADLNDNCDLSRIASPTKRDHKRISKYRQAIALIETLLSQYDSPTRNTTRVHRRRRGAKSERGI
jgi:(p)ppGpp synthase/HD superfamily hydrolase